MEKFLRTGFLVCIAIAFMPNLAFMQDAGKLKKQAEVFFKNNAYQKAVYYYSQYAKQKSPDKETLYKMGVSSYETNDLSKAQKIFSGLLNEKNHNSRTYYYLGRLTHIQQDFEKATELYKMFLNKSDSDDQLRQKVRSYIRNCNVGTRLLTFPEEALVENLGRSINTIYDEFGAVQSPNYSDKIYFSSARKGSTGGLRDASGRRDNEFGNYRSDLYFSRIVNGTWAQAEVMGGLLNSEKNESLLGFNETGQVSYIFKGDNYSDGDLVVDTFRANPEDARRPRNYSSPINMQKGDQSPYFYNDSLVLFSSYRKGGFGGYDLYGMVKSNGEDWGEPFNLGPQINSKYDEVDPFLAKNGRSLFFSSNNSRKSIGGFDIFNAEYDDESKNWSNPSNLGMPINSSEDDTNFYISKDGTKAYMSSDRKTSFGMRDIYVAYFKQSRLEQNGVSSPITFMQLENVEKRLAISQQIVSGKTSNVGVSFGAEEEVEIPSEVLVESIFYQSDRDLLSEANKRKIGVLTEIMKIDKSLGLHIECHTANSGPLPFDMYFSIKRAESVAQELISQGIPARRIQVSGYGPLYPIALNEINGRKNDVGVKLNNRVDFTILGKVQEGIDVQYIKPVVSKFQVSDKGAQLKTKQSGLIYKIQIASTTQMFEGGILSSMPDPKVDKKMNSNRYLYSVGTYRSYNSAKEFKKELIKLGVIDTKVIPYIDGEIIDATRAQIMTEKYPDLKYFLQGQ